MVAALLTYQPCPHCKETIEHLLNLMTKEEIVICFRCGYFKDVSAKLDAQGIPIKRGFGYELNTIEIPNPYGILRIEEQSNAVRYIPLKNKGELPVAITVVKEMGHVVKTAEIRRFENGKVSVIDILRLVQGAN